MSRPKLPMIQMPASWGKSRVVRYAELACAYDKCPEVEVPSVLRSIATLLTETPRAPQSLVAKTWACLRYWNERQAGHKPICCPVCGEWRDVHGEGAVVSHAVILGVRGEYVDIEPTGCHHRTFNAHCLTCNHRWCPGIPVLQEYDLSQPEDDHSIN